MRSSTQIPHDGFNHKLLARYIAHVARVLSPCVRPVQSDFPETVLRLRGLITTVGNSPEIVKSPSSICISAAELGSIEMLCEMSRSVCTVGLILGIEIRGFLYQANLAVSSTLPDSTPDYSYSAWGLHK